MTDRARSRVNPTMVAAVGLILSALLVGTPLARTDWNPTLFVGFGEEAHLTTEYAEERVDHPLLLRARQGHDGKFFFVQANDPWLLDPGENASILDYPIYRSQRMLYPLLSGGFGLFGPNEVLWGMVAVNILAMALGTWATARIALALGGSAMWGLAFVGNLGLIYALTSDTADIVAAGLAFAALALLYRDRVLEAAGLLALAVLAREVMIICALGAAGWFFFQRRCRAALYTLGIPAVALGLWQIYMRLRLPGEESAPEALSHPFVGIAGAFPNWRDDATVLVTGIVVLSLMVIYVVHWARNRTLLGWAFVGFVPLAVVLSHRVWREIFDYSRALAPWLTAAILLVFVESRAERSTVGADDTGTRV